MYEVCTSKMNWKASEIQIGKHKHVGIVLNIQTVICSDTLVTWRILLNWAYSSDRNGKHSHESPYTKEAGDFILSS